MSVRPMRADIWWTEFGPPVGAEQGAGQRPSVVISSDDLHSSGAPVAVVVPVTTSQRHTRSVSTLRLVEHLGSVSAGVMDEIFRSLRYLLDLETP